jgi:hypothetical protein
LKHQPAANTQQGDEDSAHGCSSASLLRELDDNHEFLLMMLDGPITFHRAYVPMTGMVTAALLLSHVVQTCTDGETHDGITDSDGWFTKTQQQWTDEIGLSRDETATARSKLRDLGVISERVVRDKGGFKSSLQFRANFDRIEALLAEQARAMRSRAMRSTAH